jgi:endonuclease YncB( thermonuclease family)
MAKVRLKNEWKMWAGVAAICLLIAGYLYMVSRPPMEDGEYLWRVMKVTGDKELNLKGSGKLIDMRLIGLRIPTSEAPAAREYLTKNLENKWVRIKILREDPKGVKEGLVYLSKEDIIARMVRQGLAEVDRNERTPDFDVRSYIELEQEAKREQRGLWHEAASGAQ